MTSNVASHAMRSGAPNAVLLSAVMRGSLLVMVLWVSSSALACSVEEGGAGDACLRSTECAAGLVCLEGFCSSDLSAIADPGEVPMLMPEAGVDPVPDASEMPVDAAMMTPPADAAMMMPLADAAVPADGA